MPTNTEISATTTSISIPIITWVFKFDFGSYCGWFSLTVAENVFQARRQGIKCPCAPFVMAFQILTPTYPAKLNLEGFYEEKGDF